MYSIEVKMHYYYLNYEMINADKFLLGKLLLGYYLFYMCYQFLDLKISIK